MAILNKAGSVGVYNLTIYTNLTSRFLGFNPQWEHQHNNMHVSFYVGFSPAIAVCQTCRKCFYVVLLLWHNVQS